MLHRHGMLHSDKTGCLDSTNHRWIKLFKKMVWNYRLYKQCTGSLPLFQLVQSRLTKRLIVEFSSEHVRPKMFNNQPFRESALDELEKREGAGTLFVQSIIAKCSSTSCGPQKNTFSRWFGGKKTITHCNKTNFRLRFFPKCFRVLLLVL